MNLIVDGSNLAYRHHARMEGLSTSDGQPTTVLFGVLDTFRSVMQEYPATSITVVWDGGHSDRRQEIHEEYKQRDKDQETERFLRKMYSQVDVLDGWLFENLGIASVQISGYEGDDVIYFISELLDDAVVYSGDKDFYQVLTNEETKFLRARSKDDVLYTDPDDDRIPVPAKKFIWYLAMVGDKSDNIPGVDGVGEKRAQKIVEGYDSFKNFKQKAKDIRESSVEPDTKYKQSVIDSVDLIERNMKLIDLSLEQYPMGTIKRIIKKLKEPKEFNPEKFQSFIEDYEMQSFEDDFGKFSRMFYGLRKPHDEIREDFETTVEEFCI